MIDERQFPILGYYPGLPDFPRSLPWRLVEPARKQAMANHKQTLERLAERGGLAPAELLLALSGLDLLFRPFPSEDDAIKFIHDLTKRDAEAKREGGGNEARAGRSE